MKIKLKKLNSHGFAHHLLIPVIAVVVVAGIGTYIITKSHANQIPGGGGTSLAGTCSISAPNSVAVGTAINPKLTVRNTGTKSFTPNVAMGAGNGRQGWSNNYTLSSIAPGATTSRYFGTVTFTKTNKGQTWTYAAKSLTASVPYSCTKKVTVY